MDFKYRPDIDGLRAIAVSMVVLNHAGFALSGGYVGVDIFFVISGFLITGLIRKELRAGTFRFTDFWFRRIRRIVPASSAMVLTTLIAGTILLLPVDLKELARSAISQQLITSNHFFSRHTGYFDGNANLKPLLHTWSLSVEEQFYLIYPLLLVLIIRYRQSMTHVVMIAMAIASFGLSIWGVQNSPLPTFYLLPSRAWELLLGGLICFLPTPAKWKAWHSNLLSFGGITGILAPAIMYDAATKFPGPAALLPCMGTAILIHVNSSQLSLVGRLLAVKSVVFVGLLSYSLYLWHWPILVFMAYWHVGDVPALYRGLAIGLSFLVAYLSWRFIETPFRQKRFLLDRRRLFYTAGATAFGLIGFCLTIRINDGFKWRFDNRTNVYASAVGQRGNIHRATTELVRARKLPMLGNPSGPLRCLIWGDSHAMALVPALEAICLERGCRCVQVTHSSTAPLLDFVSNGRTALKKDSVEFNDSVLEFVLSERVEIVVLAGFWSQYYAEPNFRECLDKTLSELTRAGVRTIVVKDVATQDADIPRTLAKSAWLGQDVSKVGISWSSHERSRQSIEALFEKIKSSHVLVVDPVPSFVDSQGIVRGELEGVPMYCDAHHLTVDGALRLASVFRDAFDHLDIANVQDTTKRR